MHLHISYLCRSSFFIFRRVASVRSYLTESTTARLVSSFIESTTARLVSSFTESTTARLVSSFITSKLDYCNSIFAGLPATEINGLQRIQNSATKLVLRTSKRDHISPLFQHSRWLPIPAQIDHKISKPVHLDFDGSLPPYLSSILVIYQPFRSLRSSHEKLFKVPRKNLKAFGPRSFSYQALTVWNSLPSAIRQPPSLASFKTILKIHPFVKSFHHSQ